MVVGTLDPLERTRGEGVRILTEAGIEVAAGREQQQQLAVLAALGLVHGECQGRFRPAQPGWMQQAAAWEQHQPPAAGACHQHADVAVGQPLLGQVAAVEHRGAQRPALQRPGQCVAEQGPLHPLHPPGPLADRAEQDQALQFGQQGLGGGRARTALRCWFTGQLARHAESVRQLAVADRLRSLGWTQRHDTGAGFGDVQPRYVFQVPLAGRSEADLQLGFNQLWRRNIKVATRGEVTVVSGDYDDLPAFHALYVETAARDGFTPRSLAYFQRMWRAMTAEDPDRLRLYLARLDDRVLAATTMVRVGTHAWYSYGASSTEGRHVRPSNAIQWQMMRDALTAGCSVYDMRGISDTLDPDDPLFGLLQFKLGTGGGAVEYLGEWDLALRPVMARAFDAYLARR